MSCSRRSTEVCSGRIGGGITRIIGAIWYVEFVPEEPVLVCLCASSYGGIGHSCMTGVKSRDIMCMENRQSVHEILPEEYTPSRSGSVVFRRKQLRLKDVSKARTAGPASRIASL